MKRLFAVLVIFSFLVFNGCAVKEKMNLAIFINNYNSVSSDLIDFTSFSGTVENEDTTDYTFKIENDDKEVYVVLSDVNKEIKECRVVVSKLDKNFKEAPVSDELWDTFKIAAYNTAYAFTFGNSELSEYIVSTMLNDKDIPETTYKSGDYNIIYISNNLCCELIIRNRWLFSEETTVKPENKNNFEFTSPVRTETVPHR